MSEEKNTFEKESEQEDNTFHEELEKLEKRREEHAKINLLKDEVAKKKAQIDNKIYTKTLENIEEEEKDLNLIKQLNFGAMDAEHIKFLQQENIDYFEAAKHKMIFMLNDFDRIVPFYRKNIILVAAETGKGKSTAAANIAYAVLRQKKSDTGKKCRVLLITNEEKAEDFFNRITCLSKGWEYTNHDEFSHEQMQLLNKAIPLWAKDGWLTVIDNNFGGTHGLTTSVEGIQSIFENLLLKKEYYDVVMIDYYQNIILSKNSASIDHIKIQERLSKLLDIYKNIYPAPIILFAQLEPLTESNPKPFKLRIEGRKIISNICTFSMEMVVDYKRSATQWTIWKSRYTKAIGKSIWTGYDKGKFVPYTVEFQEKIQRREYERLTYENNKAIDQKNGMPEVFQKGNKQEGENE